jgi:hypothetical protein
MFEGLDFVKKTSWKIQDRIKNFWNKSYCWLCQCYWRIP